MMKCESIESVSSGCMIGMLCIFDAINSSCDSIEIGGIICHESVWTYYASSYDLLLPRKLIS